MNGQDEGVERNLVITGEFDNDLYEKVALSARLSDVRLISSKYQIKPELLFSTPEEIQMACSFSGAAESFEFQPEDGLAVGHYSWVAQVKSGRRKNLKMSAQYILAYHGLKGHMEEYVEFYFNKIGRFTTYPYFRALFSQNTAASGVVLPPLPSLTERMD